MLPDIPSFDDFDCVQFYLTAILGGGNDDGSGGSGGSVICDGDILQEDGFLVLQEDGDAICLESDDGCVVASTEDVVFEHSTNFDIAGNSVTATVPSNVPPVPTDLYYPFCYVQSTAVITNPDLLCGQYFRFTVPYLGAQFQAGIQRNLDNPTCQVVGGAVPGCEFVNGTVIDNDPMPDYRWWFDRADGSNPAAEAEFGAVTNFGSFSYDTNDVFEIGIRRTITDARVVSYRYNGTEIGIQPINSAQTDNFRFVVVAGQESTGGDPPSIIGVQIVTYSS